MTDHLDEAAAKSVDLAAAIGPVAKTTLEVEAAAHLTYMAGLLRGGRGAVVSSDSVRFVATVCPNCKEERRVAAEVGLDRARIQAQRDELLTAAKDAVSVAEDLVPGLVLDRLREAIDRVDGRV